jgi:hypothetical protein
MRKLIKKIVAGITCLACAGMLVVPGISKAVEISEECRKDTEKCTYEELTALVKEYMDKLKYWEGKLAELEGEKAPTPKKEGVAYEGIPAGFTFEKNLSKGMKDQDVVYLKIILAAEGCVSGFKNTKYFGSKTLAGVQCFCNKYKKEISAAAGYEVACSGFVGKGIRAKLNSLLAAAPSVKEEKKEEKKEEAITKGLTVALSNETPPADKVPTGVDNVLFTLINFTAGEEIVVKAITITRTGLGADADIAAVTLYDGNEKLGVTRTSFNSLHQMKFNIPEGWTIPAGSTKTLAIRARVRTPGTYNALGIASANDIVLAKGEVSGNFPIYGNQMTGVAVTVGQVTIDGEGVTALTKRIGVDGVTLASFSLRADGTEDLSFEKITLKNVGTAADTDVGNLCLKKEDKILAGPVSMSKDYVTFVLDTPYTLKKNEKVTFKVVGDIEDGVGHTIEFILKNDIDLVCRGAFYGYNARVNRAEFDDPADGNTTQTTIQGAQLNVNLVSTNLDTPAKVYDISFGTLELEATAEDTRITRIVLVINETDGDANVNNNRDVDELELVDLADGSSYMATMTGGGDNNANNEIWTIEDEIYLTKGVKRSFKIRGDLPSGIGNGDQYNVAITVNNANLPAEGVISGNPITDYSVTALTGKRITVKSPSLTVLSSSMNPGDAVIGATNVVLFEGTLKAGTASDVTINRMRFVAEAANQFDVDNINRVILYTSAGDQQIITGRELVDDVADFDELSILVPAGAANAVSFGVKADFRNTFTNNRTVRLRLVQVSARDKDGETVTVTNEAGNEITEANPLTTNRVITLHERGILKVSIPVSDPDVDNDRYVLANTVSDWIGKIKIKAENEPVIIKEIHLENETANDEDSVKTVSIYKGDKETLLGSATLLGTNRVSFTELNYKASLATEYLYLKADLRKIGTGVSDTADSEDALRFRVSQIVAEGANSGDALVTGDNDGAVEDREIVYDTDLDGNYDETAANGDAARTSFTKEFTVVGTRISAVNLVKSAGGKSIASSLSGGVNNVAILEIVTDTTNNTDNAGVVLKTVIQQIRVRVTRDAGTTINGMTIERIGGSGNAEAMVVDLNQNAATSPASENWRNPNDVKINSGETAYFLIKANLTLGAARDWIQIDLDQLDGAAATNNIDWRDGDATHPDGTQPATFQNLRLDYTSVDGIKILEPVS